VAPSIVYTVENLIAAKVKDQTILSSTFARPRVYHREACAVDQTPRSNISPKVISCKEIVL
jgi:hypothetical protein